MHHQGVSIPNPERHMNSTSCINSKTQVDMFSLFSYYFVLFTMSQIWLITGCSSGFGLSLALAALKAGHQVVATSRSPSKTPDLISQVKSLGGQWKALDVSDPKGGSIIEEVIKEFGKIDVLVNNAGIALIGAFEDMR